MKKQVFKIKWLNSKHRQDKRTGAISPVKPSRYSKYLMDKGAGFNE